MAVVYVIYSTLSRNVSAINPLPGCGMCVFLALCMLKATARFMRCFACCRYAIHNAGIGFTLKKVGTIAFTVHACAHTESCYVIPLTKCPLFSNFVSLLKLL